ncbi:MAG: Stk1 family PASTA domain-containing Ser/Thr kinase [Oscillospiraceae bacterium]|nr:Stk1 family PASTA domain-containing Ser/Thr kinase [Oscillospiraceae bacterium]
MDYNYVGKVLDGRYEIQEVLGIGGMAIVYRAYDNIDDRPVAVKILKDECLANEEFRRRFKNESRAIAMLSHPNIVKVYDVSYGERLQYIVMEYVEGISLKEYIEQRRVLPWKEAVHFLTQILRALQHAHDRGVVHRDIKPQNIMLLHSGNIKVTDFGIARLARSETRTISENAIGSVHYISPEQARGDLTDSKSDIYSLGVALYEMLTGQLPFQSDSTVSIAIMQLQTQPRLPREINDQFPAGLEQITLRAMQKNPADRYQSAAEMLLDLEEFKRNPAVVFDYAPVAQTATRYISPGETRALTPLRPAAPAPHTDEFQPAPAPKNRNLQIMLGIVGGIVGLLAIVAVVIFFLGQDDRVRVQDFVGMNEMTVQQNATWRRTYEFTIVSDPDSGQEPGTIVRQEPQAGARVAPENVEVDGETRMRVSVTLFVAGDVARRVPDVRNTSLAEAEAELRELGLLPRTQRYVTTRVEEGHVVRTDPRHGTSVDLGQVIILYVAIPRDPDLDSEVPELLRWTVEEAQDLLESVNLQLGTVTVQPDEEQQGRVIAQSIDAGEIVASGTRVNVVVSSGVIPSINVSIPVPSRGWVLTQGRLTIYMDGEQVLNQNVPLNGPRTFEIRGRGESAQLRAYLDGDILYSATINFRVNPPVIVSSNEHGATPDPLHQIPNVVGDTTNTAVQRLQYFGFNNIVIVDVPLGDGTAGTVATQIPRAWQWLNLEDEIVLEVYA